MKAFSSAAATGSAAALPSLGGSTAAARREGVPAPPRAVDVTRRVRG